VNGSDGYGIGALTRDLRARFRLGWLRIDAADRRRWLRTIAAGILGMFLLMLAFVQVGKGLLASGALDWEADFLRTLENGGPMSFSTAVWFQTFGTDITLWILVSLTAGIATWAGRPIAALSVVLAYAVLDLVVRFGWMTWDRARPDILYGGVTAPSFHAFPSGHTAKTFAVYGTLIYLWVRSAPGPLEKAAALLVLAFIALVVPFGRMTMGVHWPSDVIAGWLIGAIWLLFLIAAMRYERSARAATPIPSLPRGG
jgi:membrane-associated phospholipid phosphatase